MIPTQSSEGLDTYSALTNDRAPGRRTTISRMSSLITALQTQDEDDFDNSTFETVWLRSRKASLFRAFLNEFIKRNVFVATANGWPVDAATVEEAVRDLALEIRAGSRRSTASPSWLFVACSETLEPQQVLDEIGKTYPNTRCIHCITSCQGVTTDTGFKTITDSKGVTRAISMMAVHDPLGAFATIGMAPPDTPQAAQEFEQALDTAYKALRESALDIMKDPTHNGAKLPGPEPLAEHLCVWMSGLPGTEEKSLEVLYEWGHKRFNRTVPVVGGTGADATIGGKWRAYCKATDGREYIYGPETGPGVIITLIAASVKVFPCFMHPFTPMTENTAKVVSAGPSEDAVEPVGRVIHTLKGPDGQEVGAGTLYHRWCEDLIQKKLMPPPLAADGPGAFNPAVLAASTACPLGVAVAREGDDAYDYRMMHPSGIYWFKDQEKKQESAYLKNFASVETGKTDIVLFKARRGDLLSRLSKMKEQLVTQIDQASGGSSLESVALSPDALRARISGVLMVYCAGCMLAVNSGKDGTEQMRRLTVSLSNCFGGRPFMAYHPFGEQGFFPSKQVNHHSNLMFSALVFSKDPAFEVDESRSFADMMTQIVDNYEESEQAVLKQLLARGDGTDFTLLSHIIRLGTLTPELLKSITPCAGSPIPFALNSAQMFHTMARKFPLKAKEYTAASRWFKEFCKDFVNASSLMLLSQSNAMQYPTLRQSVLMAVTIDSKALVATSHFQEIMEKVWVSTSDTNEAIVMLLNDAMSGKDGQVVSWLPPMWRHYMNIFSYATLTFLQYYTSQYNTNSPALWGLILTWSLSNMLQTLASPTTGYYSFLTILDDIVIVFAHVGIVWKVCMMGEEVPRDLDAITMILHFGNLLKGLVVHPKLGPLILMVVTMMGDITQFGTLMVFFIGCFYTALNALFRGIPASYVGDNWKSPTTLLVNAIWGPQILWDTSGDDLGQTLFLSELVGVDDSIAVDYMGAVVVALAVMCIPIMLLNLLIAIMASTYQSLAADVDAEYKRSFASCVLVARELPPLPMPFSLPWDLVRCLLRLLSGRDAAKTSDDEADATLKQQLAMSQIVSSWEAMASIEKFKGMVTIEQVERMRTQGDGLQDRIHVMYSALLNLTERQDKMENKLSSAIAALSKRM